MQCPSVSPFSDFLELTNKINKKDMFVLDKLDEDHAFERFDIYATKKEHKTLIKYIISMCSLCLCSIWYKLKTWDVLEKRGCDK